MNWKENKYFWIATLIFVTALTRLMPHPWNFTPVTALFIFGGAQSGKNLFNFILPFSALLISDFLLNNFIYHHSGITIFYKGAFFIYLSYALIFLFNYFLKPEWGYKLVVGAFGSSVLFFIITNFASWLSNPIYSQDLSGLLTSYSAGLPFFRNAIIGDLLYSFALFGVFNMIQYSFLKKSFVRSKN